MQRGWNCFLTTMCPCPCATGDDKSDQIPCISSKSSLSLWQYRLPYSPALLQPPAVSLGHPWVLSPAGNGSAVLGTWLQGSGEPAPPYVTK